MDLLVYSHIESPRLSYILDLLLNEISGLSFIITTDRTEFDTYNGPKINYSENRIDDKSVWIIPHGMIFETDIKEQEITVSDWDNHKIFFCTSGTDSDIPFDIFAAGFYLVSRYEEYLPGKGDKYGRFEAGKSMAQIHGFLNKPLVNQWAMKLKDILLKKYPELSIPGKRFEYVSTIDIDNAWAYMHKGFFRTTGAFIKSLARLDFEDFNRRIRTLTGACNDPYFNFDYIIEQEKKYGFNSKYFFLTGKYGKYDKNISIDNRAFQDLILDKQEKAEIGIHPSYNSNNDFKILEKEVNRFSELIKTEVKRSRQHYLILKFPETYQSLIKLGITEDYSLGYSSAAGFRAGTCNPFRFYDLSVEKETDLVLIPFHIMDVTLREYMKLQPDEAIRVVKDIIQTVKNVNGTFISLWHNESFSETGQWKGWRRVYEEMLKCIYKS